MIQLQRHPEGLLLPVRAFPGARRQAVGGQQDGMLKVYVTQVAEKGKANKALTNALAKNLGLRRSQIQLVAGYNSHQKKFLVRGVTEADLRARLDQL